MAKRLSVVVGMVFAASLIGCSSTLAANAIRVPCPGIELSGLSWSADSTQIAYFAEHQSGTMTLNTIDLTSGRTATLTEVTGPPQVAAWSPDSRRLVIGHRVS